MTGRSSSMERGNRNQSERAPPKESAIRGQSEVLSVVLLLAITITGTGVIVAFGSTALSDSQQAAEINSAEHAMTQLDSKASLVGVGASTSQSVSLGLDATTRVENQSGWMRVVVDPMNQSAEAVTVMNQTLGAVIYENGDTAIAYQGGGVWKASANGTTMVSPPEVHYRETTLTLPLVVVSGQGPLSGKTMVRQNGTATPKYPNKSAGFHNPLTQAEVNITVQSTYYRAWGRFFEQRTGGKVSFDHGNKTATLRLVTPPNVPQVQQGVASTSSQKLVIKGGGGSTFTNSYNSSNASYEEHHSSNGTVKTVGGVTMNGDAEIRGDLVSGGGEVDMGKNTRIWGNLSYGGSTDLHHKTEIDGWTAANGSVAKIDPVGGMVLSKNESIHDQNDNGDDDDITGNALADDCSPCKLTNGSYYIEGINLDGGEKLVFNLSEGSIDLAVSGPIVLDGGKINVTNSENGRVNVYMDATTMSVTSGATVTVPGDKSGRFRIYGPPGVEAEFTGSGTKFVGMLYSPDSESQHGAISVTSQAKVFGALVGGRTELRSGGTVHYDAALAQSSPLPPGYETAPHVTYMHVTVSRVNVTSV